MCFCVQCNFAECTVQLFVVKFFLEYPPESTEPGNLWHLDHGGLETSERRNLGAEPTQIRHRVCWALKQMSERG
jgi:hypothetical protein